MEEFDIPAVKLTDENIKGSISFLIDVYQDPESLSRSGFTKLHSHSEIHFCYVVQGQVEFIVEQKRYVARKGEAVYIASRCIHMSRAYERGSFYMCFNIKPELLMSFIKSVDGRQYITRFLQNPEFSSFILQSNVDWQENILLLLKKIYRLYTEEKFGYELQVASCLIEIWYMMLLGNQNTILKGCQEENIDQFRIKKALQYIEEHYQEKITLGDMAKELNVSKEEICRIFKRNLKMTCMEYINNYRIMKSMDMLSYTKLMVGEIGSKVGFDNFSYFSECFKKKVGCTPSAYRAKLTSIKVDLE